ncbi:DUF4225 domain-containing protein [Pseudomonas prosekii]|uniref:DUF4225 domain-containing protein n=1 Tax=Pseudomonas prosekii TaxID=1148509 RepID=UPI0021CC888E|nr:DUF4225 domain-containing protein [Pseudomonas prosekii]
MQAQAHTVLGATRVNESTCDIHDVTRAASDLIAFGCTLGATQFFDSFMQIQFSSIVSSYANEIIAAVDEGIISAQEALREIRLEYAELSSKALFYAQNGAGVIAGAMQLESGISKLGNTRGLGLIAGGPLIAHGVNNIYEGFGNIYNGPGAPSVVGPIRKIYQEQLEDPQTGNMAYYSVDLYLSIQELASSVRRPNSVQLFRRDPLNYQMAYKQLGKPALAFEAIMDGITTTSIINEINTANALTEKK